jgi:hypothetical protein
MIAIRSIQKGPHIANIGPFSIVKSRFISRKKMSENLCYGLLGVARDSRWCFLNDAVSISETELSADCFIW